VDGASAAGVASPVAPDAAPATTAGLAGAVPGAAANTLAPPPAAPSGAALEIDFLGDCWVEAIGPTGARLMYELGRAGQSRALPGPGPWSVSLGAADYARLRVGGRPVPVPAANRSGATARLVVGPDGTVQ
jgi:cytoskeleton protein RodZ